MILLIAIGLGGFFLASKQLVSNSNDLPDIDPSDQGGSFDCAYDDTFYQVSIAKGVPFALLKAHAIRESSLNPKAYLQEPSGKASYGLMQILWWKNSNRFADYGYSDDQIGDGSLLYNPDINTIIAAEIILANLRDFGNLRDAINAYNTGTSEAKHIAPHNYVNDVLKYYSTLIKGSVT